MEYFIMATKAKENETEDASSKGDAPTASVSKDKELVKVKITVNVWDHNGDKLEKGSVATLQRAQAMSLLDEGKATRIDPIPTEEG